MGAYGDHLEALATEKALATLNRIDQCTTRMEAMMATLNDALTGIANAVSGLEEDVNRLVAVVQNEELSPEAQAAVDAIQQRMASLNALADAAVPPPMPEPL
jgi:archaellum component FlaC